MLPASVLLAFLLGATPLPVDELNMNPIPVAATRSCKKTDCQRNCDVGVIKCQRENRPEATCTANDKKCRQYCAINCD